MEKQTLLNPRTTSYEFLGPPGALLITLGVHPNLCSLLRLLRSFGRLSPDTGPSPYFLALSDPAWWKSLWDTQAALIYLAWYTFCIVIWAILPGDRVEGATLRTGGKKQYKINAFSTFVLTLGLTLGTIHRCGPELFTFLHDNFVGFVTAYCYASSFRPGALLAIGGDSGNFVYDIIGRELNPSIGSFDIKTFNELRPGMILWTLVDISRACEQARRRGGFGKVTDSLWLILFFQGGYIADALYNEPDIFRQIDITTGGFGFMLSVGDLAWLSFIYSLQARGSNPKNLKFFATKSGLKLLTSGWWGASRHPNYFGDILMALAWSLPTAFGTPITYFYVIYFIVLLIHRQRRDDENCKRKYGNDWKKYMKLVPYRIVPYVY
ncbi:ERG4/ERG24 ergosterol biosynthesis protein [Mycena latifolia]|nr:ERG4/ERG24 ergosterol biosynthesis protein [Mycena latifolia]